MGVANVRIGPGDDAAVLADGTAITADALIEGVHFDVRLSPIDVGYKAIAVSVSDLAAMGAQPRWAVLTLAVPRPVDLPWVHDFAAGVGQACAHWALELVGGDTTRSPGPRNISVTLGGPCIAAPLRRSGGRAGDDLWVTGTLGLAAGGYLLPDPPAACRNALHRPTPPLAFALHIAAQGWVSAAMDVSDGLALDMPKLCAASGTGAIVEPDALPIPDALAPLADPAAAVWAGGDDYQLLFAAPPCHSNALQHAANQHDVRVTRIGTLTVNTAVVLRGRPWPQPPFRHFGKAE